MNPKRMFFALIAGLVLTVGLVGGAMYFGYTSMKASSNSLVNAKLDTMLAEEKEKTFIKAKKDLEKYKGLSETLQKILPKDKDQARAVRELYKISDEAGVSIVSITFPSSTLGARTAAPPASTEASKTATSSSVAQSTVSQAAPVSGLPGVQGIDLELSVEGQNDNFTQFSRMVTFLQKVEQNRRSMQIKKITVTPDDATRNVKFELTVTIFVKP
jgi:hypothetical protein